ncbi:unnamed protein product [Musa acuminata subsp. malaccensis]|uniref:(wild Malaysian banana) hypothetical protein n=1 Tax=Musa acuminata subsp. malaccensis TaxID=214687 RepID=A0A804K1C4_MUSAM|nr:unnamed protein product [Musa acuminata subsp. malaccensis]
MAKQYICWLHGGQILKLYSVVPPPHLEKKSRHLVGSFLGNDSIANRIWIVTSTR